MLLIVTYLLSGHNATTRMTKYQDTAEVLQNMLGTDHNSAEVRHKVKSTPSNSNYDGQYIHGYGEDNVNIKYTEEGGSTYIRLSGHNGRDHVFSTFKADQYSIEDVVQKVESELDINFTEK